MLRTPLARIVLTLVAALVLGALASPLWLTPLVAGRVRAAAASRGLLASWSALRLSWPLTVRIDGLVLRRAERDTLLAARSVAIRARAGSVLLLRPALAGARLDGARVRLPSNPADEDSLAALAAAPDPPAPAGAVSPRVMRAARELTRALLVSARRLPELQLTDVRIERGDSTAVVLEALSLRHPASALELAVTGRLESEQAIGFDSQLHWGRDDHLGGRAEFRLSDDGTASPVVLTVDGHVVQDRAAGQLRIAPDTHVTLGVMDMRIEGFTDTHGPRFAFQVALDSLTADRVQRSLPRALLGPLADLAVSGSFDWHAALDLDLARPDSVRFRADVVPHRLALEAAGSSLRLAALREPFLAAIHLPRERIVYRELSQSNPHFRPLEDISEYLRFAVVTNEDGGFFWHRGFNTGAIQLAMAANLRAGAYKRGAGTITMQVARNLYLGHRRTLSRKAQEVVLAWVLEHLAGVPKERLLEIYLNIIEWGPEVHGADEAARFYFDTDAADVTLPEALFLAILVPSPSKWRWRLDANGDLRPFAREQMHFIGRKMQAKGWLGPDELPDADSLRIELRGAARALFER